jgi:hypothetical protein
MGMILSKDEIAQLTSRTRRDAQVLQLNYLGVTYRVRTDGSIVVLRAHVERLFGVTPSTEAPRQPPAPFVIAPAGSPVDPSPWTREALFGSAPKTKEQRAGERIAKARKNAIAKGWRKK